MPNRKLSYAVDVDSSSAVRDLRRLGTEGARAGRELADGFDDAASAGDKALAVLSAGMDRLEADVTGTAKAVKAVGQAAGDGFDSARIEGFVADLNRMGVSFDEIEGKANEFADVMRRADQVKLDAANQGLTQVGTNLDRVRDSGDQSRSVLANLAGNAAQDLGQLGGAVGTLGVGIGQLAEYAVDGNIALSNLAKVAGPMAGLAAATLLVTKGMESMAKVDAFNTERADMFTESIQEGADVWQTLREQIADTGELLTAQDGPFGNSFFGDVENILPKLQQLGLTFADFQELASNPAAFQGLSEFRDSLDAAQYPELRSNILQVLEAVTDYASAASDAALAQDALNEFLGAPDASLDEINAALTETANAATRTGEIWRVLLNDLADNGAVDTAAPAWNALREELGLTDDEMSKLVQQKLDEKLEADAEAATAAAEAHDELAAAIGAAVDGMDTAESRSAAFATALERVAGAASELTQAQEGIAFADNLRTLGDALGELGDTVNTVDLVPDDWGEFQNIPDELRPVVDALAGFRDSVQSELAQAFETGGATGVDRWANETRRAVEDTMAAAGVEVRDAAGNYTAAAEQILSSLGLLPDQVTTTVEVAVDQQQLAVLGEVTSALDDLPAAKRAEIELAINGGDPDEALRLINEHLLSIGQEPIVLDVTATTDADDVDEAYDDATRDRDTEIDADTNADQAGGDLDDAAADRETTISANVRQQIIQGLILGAYLDWVARPREARIDTELYGWATAAAVLNAVAKTRTAPVVVELPNYWTAEAALDRLARTRFSRIYTTRSSGGMTPTAAEATALTADAELAATPMAVATLEAPAAAQTVVVDQRPINVSVNAAVIGSTYAVQRAVSGALARAERLGRR